MYFGTGPRILDLATTKATAPTTSRQNGHRARKNHPASGKWRAIYHKQYLAIISNAKDSAQRRRMTDSFGVKRLQKRKPIATGVTAARNPLKHTSSERAYARYISQKKNHVKPTKYTSAIGRAPPTLRSKNGWGEMGERGTL
jgi:hypothetical protein